MMGVYSRKERIDMEMKRVPEIRFEGFDGEWEQRKLCEMQQDGELSLKRGNIIPKQEGRYPVYSSSAVGDGLFCTSDNFMFDDEKVTWSIDGGGRVFYRPKHKFSVTNVCGYVDILDKDLDCKYLSLAMEKAWKQTSFDYITKAHPSVISDLYSISIPGTDEQKDIGVTNNYIDTFIALTQQKLDSLKSIKACMLQKMFPRDGKKVPEIRFEGFTDPWEQRKVKELCSITTGKSNTQDQIDDGKYPFFIRSDTPVRSNRYLYDEEAVITIGDGNIGKVFHYVNGKFDLHQRCYKMSDFTDVLAKYFYYFFSSHFYDRAMKMTAKATVDSVRLEMISDMEILFPKSRDEQRSIAECLTALDNLITLHQRKYSGLVQIKKALLQKMLV